MNKYYGLHIENSVIIYFMEKHLNGPGLSDFDWEYIKKRPELQKEFQAIWQNIKKRFEELFKPIETTETPYPQIDDVWESATDKDDCLIIMEVQSSSMPNENRQGRVRVNNQGSIVRPYWMDVTVLQADYRKIYNQREDD